MLALGPSVSTVSRHAGGTLGALLGQEIQRNAQKPLPGIPTSTSGTACYQVATVGRSILAHRSRPATLGRTMPGGRPRPHATVFARPGYVQKISSFRKAASVAEMVLVRPLVRSGTKTFPPRPSPLLEQPERAGSLGERDSPKLFGHMVNLGAPTGSDTPRGLLGNCLRRSRCWMAILSGLICLVGNVPIKRYRGL